MAEFALMNGERVHEIIEAAGTAELAKRYSAELVARMVDVTGKDMKEGMTRSSGEFVAIETPPLRAPTLTAERLAAVLIAKGVLTAEDLAGPKVGLSSGE